MAPRDSFIDDAAAAAASRSGRDRLRRRLRPTGRAIGMAALGAACIAAGYVFARPEFVTVGLIVVLVPALTWGLRALFHPRLVTERSVFPHTLAVGDRLRVMTEVRNESFVALEPVAYVDLTPGARIASVGGVLPSISSRLHRDERKRMRRVAYSLESMRRGVHALGPLYFDNVDALGLTRRVIRAGDAETVEVWPRIHDVDVLALPAHRTGGEVETGVASSGDADDVLTREYRRGDALRRVHWRATARAGELRVRQEEHHAEVASVVLLDTAPSRIADAGRSAGDAGEHLFDLFDQAASPGAQPVDEAFEQAVSAAASVVTSLHRLGYEVELVESHADDDRDAGVRPAALRVAVEDTLDGVMRRFMRASPAPSAGAGAGADAGGGAPASSSITGLEAAMGRTGRAPLVFVHRALDGADLDRIRGLATRAEPAIALFVADDAPAAGSRGGASRETAADASGGRPIDRAAAEFARSGWRAFRMSARDQDPWRTLEPVEVVS